MHELNVHELSIFHWFHYLPTVVHTPTTSLTGLLWIAQSNTWQYICQTDSPIQWMNCKAWRSTTCSRFNKHTWIPIVLCTIFNRLPENFYNLFLTSRGKNGKVRSHKHCSVLTLEKYFCFRLLIVTSKLDQYQLNF
jgi:hypothetical protein